MPSNLSRIGPFALEERLGPENSGSVYRALQVEQRRMVALKIFPAQQLNKSSKVREGFASESARLRALVHPNIVRCYGGGVEKDTGFLAIELVEGDSLATVIERRGKLPWEFTVDVGLQICEGLSAAQEKGILHLDLTPDKLLLTREGQVKIADFRIDRLRNTLCQSSWERTAERMSYTAPEVSAGKTPTNKADLYSLGCVMFHILTGRPPFSGDSPNDICQAHRQARPPRVASQALDCPIWLDTLVDQLLEKDPAKRPHSASSVALALRETKKRMTTRTSVTEHATRGFSPLKMAADRGEADQVLGTPKPARPEGPPFYSRLWFLVACLLLLVGGLVWAVWPPSEKSLFERADKLMQTGEADDMRIARRDYLLPLLERFPDGEYSSRAREHLDTANMTSAMAKMQFNARLGRKPSSEGERLFTVAWNYEHFGDQVTARESYAAMLKVLEEDGEDRPYLLLAKRQLDEMGEPGDAASDRTQFVSERIDKAESLLENDERQEAAELLASIISLYNGNRELQPQVDRARSLLKRAEVTSLP